MAHIPWTGKTLLGLLLAAAGALLLVVVHPAASGVQPTVSAFEGTVRVDAVPGGTQVTAKIGDTVCASADVAEGSNGETFRFYRLDVPAAEDKPGCGAEGATVTFQIDGQPAKPTAVWKAGETQTVHIWAGEDFAAFSGGLSRNGQPWSAESVTVESFIGSVKCGSLSQFLFGGSSYSALIVLPASLQAGCGRAGDTITFTVDGVQANETAEWQPGFHTLDLDVTLAETSPPLPDAGGPPPGDGSGRPLWALALGASLAGMGLALAANGGRRRRA